jgi:c-di-GMP-binding flagellar brake protein YcgR
LNIPVEIGEKLGVVVMDRNGQEKECLTSQVLEFQDGVMEIAMPIREGRLVPIPVNSCVKVMYYRDNGQYCFSAKVLDRRKGKIPIVRILAISEVKKIQRRDYYRLNATLPIRVCFMDEKPDNEYSCIDTHTIDISGGGLKFASKENFSNADQMICQLTLKDKTLNIKARKVRSSSVYGEEFSFEIGVEFVDVEERIRDEIVNFIFDEQRRLRRKGMM